MSDIVKLEAQALGSWMQNAEALASADLLPASYRNKPANILLAIQTGAPLGFGALESINGIHVINGKPTMSADLVQAAVRKAGHRLRVSGDDTFAEAVLIRADDPDFEFKVRWDMKRAQAAGLTGNPTWKKFPAAMLRSRAITEVARAGAADALHGVIYTPEELGAQVDDGGEPVEYVEKPRQPVQEPAAPPALSPQGAQEWTAAIASCTSKEKLRALWGKAQEMQVLAHLMPNGRTLQDTIKAASELLDEPLPEPPADEVEAEVIEGEIVEPVADDA